MLDIADALYVEIATTVPRTLAGIAVKFKFFLVAVENGIGYRDDDMARTALEGVERMIGGTS